MQEQRPAWDARLINWMQESARHDRARPRPIRRGETVVLVLVLLVFAVSWVVTGIDTWPAVAGIGVGLAARLWESRPGRP
jgi:cobalamin biosynthesis protein CobD/CbiB